MKTLSNKFLAFAMLVLLCGELQAQSSGLTTAQKSKIEAVIQPLVQSNNYSGSVLIARKGEVLFSKSYGQRYRDKEVPNDSESRYFLASASMIFTSAAIMKLTDEGKLHPEDKVSKFLPDYKHGDKMTIYHLLTERAGIPAIGTGGNVSYGRVTRSAQSIDDLMGYFEDYDLLYEPGSKYSHERSSYIMLAKIIELVSGKTFGEYLQSEIFDPLGMKNSGHFSHLDKYDEIPNLALGYQQRGIDDLSLAPQIHWSSKTGHASIYSTTEDLYKFANAILNKEFLSSTSWKYTFTNHGDGFGYGWFIGPQGERKRYVMNGRSPGFTSYLSVFPEDDLVVIMLANTYISVPHFTAPKLAAIMLDEPYEALNLSGKDVGQSYADQVTGYYQFGDFYRPNGRVRISYKDGRLYSDGGPLIPIEENGVMSNKFIHRRYWSTLEFVMEDGKAIALKFDHFKGKKK